MRPHPFAEEYPPVSAEKLAEITDNMREHGFDRRFPTVVYRNMILDGRSREAAAKAAGIKPRRITFKGTPDQARQFVETANLHRRHLTPEQQEERRQARIETVAELRQEGESLRAIAEKVGVSESTVRGDLETATAQGCAVDPPDGKVTGKDGRRKPASNPPILCGRCRRVGPVKDCPRCKEERAAARSGREAGTHEPRARGPKAGKETYDWRPFHDGFGLLTRQVDRVGNLYGCKESGEAERLRTLLSEWKAKFTAWFSTVSRSAAPKE